MNPKQANDVMTGPNSRLKVQPLLLVTPHHLEKLAQTYCLWAHSAKTPTYYCLINDLSSHSLALNSIKVLLYSSKIKQQSDLYQLCGTLSLMHANALSTWRLWPIDEVFTVDDLPNEYESLSQIYHPCRIKALSLLLGGVTLVTALRQGQQMLVDTKEVRNPLMNEPNFVDLEEHSRSPRSLKTTHFKNTEFIYYFPKDVLWQKIKEIEDFGRRAYIPLLSGLCLFCCATFALYTPEYNDGSSQVLILVFVLGQLIFGIGVIALFWSVFEHRALKQRVYLFWLDPDLSD